MNKLIVLIGLCLFLYTEINAKIIVYGRNEGTEITVTETEYPDGRKVKTTTTVIQCNSWYQEKCYESTATIVLPNGSHRLTDGGGNVIVEGKLISADYSNHVFVFEHD
jgi:hypothetical protein